MYYKPRQKSTRVYMGNARKNLLCAKHRKHLIFACNI